MSETFLRVFLLTLFAPAIGGLVAFLRGSRRAAIAWNGLLPLLVVFGSGLAILKAPSTGFTPGGIAMFLIPVAVLAACAAGLRGGRPNAWLFWGTWIVNLAIVGFFLYLTFLFRIF